MATLNPVARKKSRRRSKRQLRLTTPLTFASPFPPRMIKVVRYSDKFALTEAAAGAGAFNVFTPSSLYDPDNTGVGHQPMFFDQLCTSTGPYTQYRALRTVSRISFANNVDTPCIVGWYVSTNGTAPATYTTTLEKPWCRYKMVGAKTGGGANWDAVAVIDHAKGFGLVRSHLENDDYYAGAYNSSPSKNLYFAVFTYGTSAVSSVFMTVELEIEAEFFSLNNTAGS